MQGLNVINENIWAGLSAAYPNKQGAELIFHKEYKFNTSLKILYKLLSAVSRLRGIFREVYKHLRRYILSL